MRGDHQRQHRKGQGVVQWTDQRPKALPEDRAVHDTFLHFRELRHNPRRASHHKQAIFAGQVEFARGEDHLDRDLLAIFDQQSRVFSRIHSHVNRDNQMPKSVVFPFISLRKTGDWSKVQGLLHICYFRFGILRSKWPDVQRYLLFAWAGVFPVDARLSLQLGESHEIFPASLAE